MSSTIEKDCAALNHVNDDGFFIVDESEVITHKAKAEPNLANQEFIEMENSLIESPIESPIENPVESIDYKVLYLEANDARQSLQNEYDTFKLNHSESEFNQIKLELSETKMNNKKLGKLVDQLTETCVKHEQHITTLGKVSQLDAQQIKDTLIALEVSKAKAENDKKQAVDQLRSEMKTEINRIINEAETKLSQFEREILTQYQPKRVPQVVDQQLDKLKQELQQSQIQTNNLKTELKTLTINSEYMQLQMDDYKQCLESSKNDNETLNEIIALLKSDAN